MRPVTPAGGRWQISTGGGRWPRWSRDGKTLFYRQGESIFRVPVSIAGNDVRSEKPALLFSMPGLSGYDVTKDGFVVARNGGDPRETRQLNMIVNWKP